MDSRRARTCEDFANEAFLREITRVALGEIGLEFAQQLATGMPVSPMALRRVSNDMVEAQLEEAHGELARGVELYVSAEEDGGRFSFPNERSRSLAGGRCLIGLDDPEAVLMSRDAREVFASLMAELYIPEVDALLEQAVARSS